MLSSPYPTRSTGSLLYKKRPSPILLSQSQGLFIFTASDNLLQHRASGLGAHRLGPVALALGLLQHLLGFEKRQQYSVKAQAQVVGHLIVYLLQHYNRTETSRMRRRDQHRHRVHTRVTHPRHEIALVVPQRAIGKLGGCTVTFLRLFGDLGVSALALGLRAEFSVRRIKGGKASHAWVQRHDLWQTTCSRNTPGRKQPRSSVNIIS